MATLVNMAGVAADDTLPTPKQIRFINNQGQPPTKRRRINAACLTCRKRKTRCAGEHPACSTCENNGHVCLGYSDVAEKRKDIDLLDTDHDPDSKQSQHHFDNSRDTSAIPSRIDTPHDHAAATPHHFPSKTDAVDWEDAHSQKSQTTPRRDTNTSRPTTNRQTSFSTEDGRSSHSRSPMLHHNDTGLRVPYFRYFGPTAIVPGFKQMVVKVQNSQRRSSTSTTSPSTGSISAGLLSMTQPDLDLGNIEDIPFYDPNDPNPVHPLILNLIETFFLRLGSTYPFLRRQKFPQLVKEKRVEPILVDAICALSARFSDVSLLKNYNNGKLAQSEYGHVYAQRAKAATVDTFACPSVAAVQACLLMAYDGFGADQDSALWMYLGVAIRMAIDLGLPKEDGVKYRGTKDPSYICWHERRNEASNEDHQQHGDEPALSAEEQREIEQERIDTFWAVFFLDRAISCGTGRPVTLKDDDFDLTLPKSSLNPSSKWPDPYASLIHIIHLNGRVSDVLNNIKQPKDLTKDKLHRLVAMENELTKLHQRMDPRLRFDANNFQAHVKNGNGTTFILLHFWFHSLIIVLHQPTLLTSRGTINRKHQLRPHSRELSMSSAKTIADILAFAELLDPRCFIGNPFTSQPIYVAACAFLLESKANSSQPDSRDPSPPPESKNQAPQTSEQSNASSKHLLLASAALQNYQLCYKALKQMHAYWGGVHYILNVLDQKSNGEWDCETYTMEEYESTKRSRGDSVVQRFARSQDFPASPLPIPESGPPLAWSLTGTTNSPNSSLTLLFQNPVNVQGHHPTSHQHAVPPPQQNSAPTPPGNMIYDPIRQSLPETAMYPPAYPQANTSALRHSVQNTQLRYGDMSRDDGAKMGQRQENTKMGIIPVASQGGAPMPGVAFTSNNQASLGYEQHANYLRSASPSSTHSQTLGGPNSNSTPGTTSAYTIDSGGVPSTFASSGSGLASSAYSYTNISSGAPGSGSNLHLLTYDNETDIGQHLTSFEHNEMLSWFGDYFPNDVFGLYPGGDSMA
ncbi:fungal-specific transcription factor domain-containing protein [Xylariaceae sp. FL0255]|nr:fungal-specific transcription factor domain-containing protein [Xylariaceae sp. FL0255]